MSQALAMLSPVEPTTADRIAGALVGGAVGDALGAPYEFEIPGPAAPQMKGGGTGPWAPGEWTDETQMTICIARAFAAGEGTVDGVGRRLLEWFHDGPKDVGHQTRIVLAAATDPAELPALAREHFANNPRASGGNTALARTAPVALAAPGDDTELARLARMVCELTHADPLCADACVLWSIALDRAIHEGRTDGVDDGLVCLPEASRAQWRGSIAQARTEGPEAFVPNAYVVRAFQSALSAVTRAAGFAEGMRIVLAAGHDTDTVGAITGSLLGARFGRSGIPREWQSRLHGWPGLGADDLADLALAVAQPR